MTKPKKVQIGALKYKIKYVVPGKGKNNLLAKTEQGCVLQSTQEIYIDSSLEGQLLLLVLIHEFLHALGDAMLPERSPFSKEMFTSTVSELLLQALESSGLLVK